MDRERIDQITAAQHSLITTSQFIDVTNSRSALRWAVDDGWLEQYRRGVYIVAGVPRTDFHPIMAACLRGGPTAAASGLAAGWLLGSPDILPGVLDITLFGGVAARRIQNVAVHQLSLPADEWIRPCSGVPTVAPALAVVQLAKQGAPYLAERLFHHLNKHNRCGPLHVLRCLDVTGYRGTEIDALRRFCERALKVHGHEDSPAASDLGVALLEAGVPPFETQYQVVVAGHVYLLDFAWPAHKVALEYHGRRDHALRLHEDALRRSRLTAAGWRVLDATSVATDREVTSWVLATLADSRFAS